MKKKIWKRAAAGTMALAMAASLSACGGKEAGSTGGGSANVPSDYSTSRDPDLIVNRLHQFS